MRPRSRRKKINSYVPSGRYFSQHSIRKLHKYSKKSSISPKEYAITPNPDTFVTYDEIIALNTSYIEESKDCKSAILSSHAAGDKLKSVKMMTSPIHSESDSFDSCRRTSGSRFDALYNRGGVLLLEEAERAPEYLRITIDSDIDEPSPDNNKSDSEEDIILLGEKRPVYQEITLEEDEEGKVIENVVEKEKSSKETAELQVFLCPSCDENFRAESLLHLHMKMHDTDRQCAKTNEQCANTKCADDDSITNSSLQPDRHKLEKRRKKKHSNEREKEEISEHHAITLKHKSHKRKHKSHKSKKSRTYE